MSIDALLTAGLAFCSDTYLLTWHYPPPTAAEPGTVGRARTLTPATAGRVGAMLLAENTRSVNYLHDEDDWEPVYLLHPLPGTPDPLAVLKAIACLEYQSCEHDGWLDSEARGVLPGAAPSGHHRTARLPRRRRMANRDPNDLPATPQHTNDQ